MRKFYTRFFGIILGGIAGLIAVEFALRILPTCQIPISENTDDEFLPKKLNPHQNGIYTKAWFFQIGAHYNTNNLGFISKKEYKPVDASKNSTVIIGDSLVELIMVEENGRFAARIESEAKRDGASLSAFDLGINGAGIADIYKFAKFAVTKLHSKSIIIKLDYGDIKDNYSKGAGHFYYVPSQNGDYDIIRIKKNESYQKFKNIAFVRYLFLNLTIRPQNFMQKFKSVLGISSETKSDLSANMTDEDRRLTTKFLSDLKKLVNGDTSRIMFIVRESGGHGDEIKSILKIEKFDFISVNDAHKDASIVNMYTFHNDSHWNPNGVCKIVSEIKKKHFWKEYIIKRNPD